MSLSLREFCLALIFEGRNTFIRLKHHNHRILNERDRKRETEIERGNVTMMNK